MADGIDAPVEAMEAPSGEAHLNRSPSDPDRGQLTVCHHPMLSLCELGDLRIDSTRSS